MKSLSLVLVALFAFGCMDRPSDDYESAEMEDSMANAAEETWMVLFDGTSTDAFRGFNRETLPSSWMIEDGTLAYVPGGSDGGDIVTRDRFSDFELELEWKISEAGNSGIIYRATEEFDAPWMTGPEYQILDNLKHPDARQGGDRLAGANYDVHPADPRAVSAVGDWNSTRIVANGPHVEHWLNGNKVVSYELYSDDWTARVADSKWVNHPEYGKRLEGHIALQDHGDRVWFRNIRIKRLGR
jgi:hypothetical protein